MNILTIILKYTPPLLCTAYIIYQWSHLTILESRILMSLNVILYIGIQNCFAPYRFYKKKSKFEYEITIFLATVKVVNTFNITIEQTQYIIIEWIFNIFLLCNILCYALSFCIIIIFVLIVIFGIIRGDFPDPRIGLNQEELNKLTQQQWELYQNTQSIDCPICLNSFEPTELVTQLPKCNHYFHTECINEWLINTPYCPSCRNSVRIALMNF